jgi:hypothetical protein
MGQLSYMVGTAQSWYQTGIRVGFGSKPLVHGDLAFFAVNVVERLGSRM